MPGPTPSDSPDRQQRPGRDVPWTDLPHAGRQGKAPATPKHVTLREAGKSWWSLAWKTPEATQWGGSEKLLAGRRAELEDLWQDGNLGLLAEMRHLESMLCMTPKARKEARWRIVGGEQAKAVPRKRGKRPELRLVDPQAS